MSDNTLHLSAQVYNALWRSFRGPDCHVTRSASRDGYYFATFSPVVRNYVTEEITAGWLERTPDEILLEGLNIGRKAIAEIRSRYPYRGDLSNLPPPTDSGWLMELAPMERG